MNSLKGTILTYGESCSGIIATQSCLTQQGDYIFLAKELDMADYDQIVRSKGVICENGGKTSHLAVICRILGKPVVLLDNATCVFHNNQTVTIDGTTGSIYLERITLPRNPLSQQDIAFLDLIQQGKIGLQLSIVDEHNIKKINTLVPNQINQFFLREEFIWVRANVSPFLFLEQHGRQKTSEFIAAALRKCTIHLKPGQCLNFRCLDMRSDECKHFYGSPDLTEANPQLGLHGIRQLLLAPDFLIAELLAIDSLYSQGIDNILLSLPFINEQGELDQVKRLIGMYCLNEIKLGVFVETPAAVVELPFMIQQGISSVYIGTKDLTQMILACDRSNKHVAHIYDSKKRPVLAFIQNILDECHMNHVRTFCFALYEDLCFFISNLKNLTDVSICSYEYERLVHDANG